MSIRSPSRESAMKFVDKTMLYLTVVPLLLSASAAPSQETKAVGKGIDPGVIAAYKKDTVNFSARYGGWIKEELRLSFKEGEDAAKKGLPGLFFWNGEPKAMPPDPGV